jgi:hypothetical protein
VLYPLSYEDEGRSIPPTVPPVLVLLLVPASSRHPWDAAGAG